MSTEEPDARVFETAGDPEAAFEAAADAIAAGEVIVLPTDTVYGVGADPFSPAAVQRLLDAKQRGRDMPPPVLVAEIEMVRSLVVSLDERIEALARAFWPGPLTIIAVAPESLRMDLGDRGNTIAVRVPDHAFTRELLRLTGPLAVSSANLNGQDAALTIADARAQLGDSIAVYLDAGSMSGPVASTIIDLSGERPRLLRAGRLTVADINAIVPGLLEEPVDDETVAAVETENVDASAILPASGDLASSPEDSATHDGGEEAPGPDVAAASATEGDSASEVAALAEPDEPSVGTESDQKDS